MYHGEAIEDEGILDERAKFVWERASREWKDFGNRELATTGYVPVTLRSIETARKNVDELKQKFAELTAPVRDKVIAAKKERATVANPRKAEAFAKSADAQTNEERMWASEFAMAIEPNYQELASELPRSDQIKALELASQLRSAEEYSRSTSSLREQVNYSYWETRALAEQQQMMVDARRLIFEGNKLIDVADIKGAVEKYEEAFVRWDKVFRYYPVIMTEDVGGDVLKAINRYKKLIDEDIDEKFVLYEFMQFRRGYDADYLDFNVEKTLSDWGARATTLGSPEDFFNTPLAKAYGISSDPPVTPSPGDNSKPEPSPAPKKPITPRDLVPEVPALPKSQLPPTLENPGA
jgi:hypothetical protein